MTHRHRRLIAFALIFEERLLDLDGDGQWEYIRSGGESLIAKYAKVLVKNAAP